MKIFVVLAALTAFFAIISCAPTAMIKQEIRLVSYPEESYFISTEVRVYQYNYCKTVEYLNVVECSKDLLDVVRDEELFKATKIFDKTKKYLENR